MRRVRVIPTLLLTAAGLVKTRQFRNARYVGDPINALRIFNEKEIDEVAVLDIEATREGRAPDVERIRQLAGECFMPLTYGGGITTIDQVQQIFAAGVEKVVLNSALVNSPALVTEIARRYGRQSVVASIDVRRSLWRGRRVYSHGASRATGLSPTDAARRAEALGAGEILLTAVDRDGMQSGYDLELIREVCGAVKLPVIASGGAATIDDLRRAVRDGGAAAVAAGSLFVFHGPHRAVLISYPDPEVLAGVGSDDGV